MVVLGERECGRATGRRRGRGGDVIGRRRRRRGRRARGTPRREGVVVTRDLGGGARARRGFDRGASGCGCVGSPGAARSPAAGPVGRDDERTRRWQRRVWYWHWPHRDDGTRHLRTAVYRVLPVPCTSRRGIGLRRFYNIYRYSSCWVRATIPVCLGACQPANRIHSQRRRCQANFTSLQSI